jgi:hypothetical protein
MNINDGVDATSAKSQSDAGNYNQPSYAHIHGMENYRPDSAPVGQNTNDPLLQAIAAQEKPDVALLAPLALTGADVARRAAEKSDSDAEAAKEKLAQEALMANPAAMRALFPKVLQDVSVNHNGYLDMYEIKQGLSNTDLPQDERNLLTVLEKGYNNFDWDPKMPAGLSGQFDTDYNGISADGLAMLDKAMNRGIKDDPYYSTQAKEGLIVGFLAGGLSGAANQARYSKDARGPLIAGLVWGACGAAIFAWDIHRDKTGGNEDRWYDQIKNGYIKFESAFNKGQAGQQQ